MNIGHRIKELRSAANLSQHQLATKAGISRSTIRDIETARQSDIYTETAKAIARALGVSPAELLDGTGAHTQIVTDTAA